MKVMAKEQSTPKRNGWPGPEEVWVSIPPGVFFPPSVASKARGSHPKLLTPIMPLRLPLPPLSRPPTYLHPFILLTSFPHSPPSSPPRIRRMLTNSPPSRRFSDLRDWGEGREEGGWLAAWGRGDPVFCQGVPPSNPAPHPGPPTRTPQRAGPCSPRIAAAGFVCSAENLRRRPGAGIDSGSAGGGSGERRGSAAGRGQRGERESEPAAVTRPGRLPALPPASLP